MESDLYPVSEQGLHAWISGTAAYQTQMVILFGSEANMRTSLHTDWETRHGIRLAYYKFSQASI
jgi:hypothetical protein